MKNGEELELLERYEIGRYTFGIPTKAPSGAWVKYNDVWTLDNNIFVALNEVESLKKRIKELEKHSSFLAERNAILLSELEEQRKDGGWYK